MKNATCKSGNLVVFLQAQFLYGFIYTISYIYIYHFLKYNTSLCQPCLKKIFSVCWPPPVIANGMHLETDNRNRPFPNTVVKYVCKKGYFPYGPNSKKLETVCLKDRSYTLQTAQLATCAPIGQFSVN